MIFLRKLLFIIILNRVNPQKIPYSSGNYSSLSAAKSKRIESFEFRQIKYKFERYNKHI